MVFLSKALILHDSLKRCRIVVVTDRIDLEEQLSSTFASGGELAGKKTKPMQWRHPGRCWRNRLAPVKNASFSPLIQKFNSATKLPECVNTSPDIIVLIDEGHRSRGEPCANETGPAECRLCGIYWYAIAKRRQDHQ